MGNSFPFIDKIKCSGRTAGTFILPHSLTPHHIIFYLQVLHQYKFYSLYRLTIDTLTMKKLIFSAIGILLYLSATAQMPERNSRK